MRLYIIPNINITTTRPLSARLAQLHYSTKRPSFFSQFIDNLKQEMDKNKDMKDNIKKFREEAQKLEQSDALKTARQKFNTVESEASKGGDVLRERIDSLKGRVQDVLEEAGKSDLGKRASNLGASSIIFVCIKFIITGGGSRARFFVCLLLSRTFAKQARSSRNRRAASPTRWPLAPSSWARRAPSRR